ncbi:MAG: hypothetical protein ABSE15_05010 [Candidatus Bathyarchaeia archaeon]|jgi:hypothetical protein
MATTDILPAGTAPVAPLVTAEQAVKQWALFEDLKGKLLNESDYQEISGKKYIKRSGFRKLAVFFGISDQIIKEERQDRPDGRFIWRVEVEARAPNGRICIGVGACDSKERRFAHEEHDVYSTSHTRAKSRAISDLVAGGAVSAEEVSEPDTQDTPEEAPAKASPATGVPTTKAPAKPSLATGVPTTKEAVSREGLRQFPLTDGLDPVGMLNVTEKEASLIPERPVKKESGAISGFLIPKILDAMKAKNGGFDYSIVENVKGEVAYILITGTLSEQQIKDLQSGARWAFIKALAPSTPA